MKKIKPLVLVIAVAGLVFIIMGLLIKYRQVTEEINGLKRDEAAQNFVKNQELALRSSSVRRSSTSHILESGERQYRSVG